MVKKIWNKRSLIGVKELSSEEINFLLDTATDFKDSKRLNLFPPVSLKGKRIVNLFLEPSTRTRIAFEVAAKSLDADIISIA